MKKEIVVRMVSMAAKVASIYFWAFFSGVTLYGNYWAMGALIKPHSAYTFTVDVRDDLAISMLYQLALCDFLVGVGVILIYEVIRRKRFNERSLFFGVMLSIAASFLFIGFAILSDKGNMAFEYLLFAAVFIALPLMATHTLLSKFGETKKNKNAEEEFTKLSEAPLATPGFIAAVTKLVDRELPSPSTISELTEIVRGLQIDVRTDVESEWQRRKIQSIVPLQLGDEDDAIISFETQIGTLVPDMQVSWGFENNRLRHVEEN